MRARWTRCELLQGRKCTRCFYCPFSKQVALYQLKLSRISYGCNLIASCFPSIGNCHDHGLFTIPYCESYENLHSHFAMVKIKTGFHGPVLRNWRRKLVFSVSGWQFWDACGWFFRISVVLTHSFTELWWLRYRLTSTFLFCPTSFLLLFLKFI